MNAMPKLILASTSRYRADLLRRLTENFVQQAPGTDETALQNEDPVDRALRLATAKATAVAAGHDNTLILGSDQVAELDGRVLDKPGTIERARTQLSDSSGRVVHFHTAICLLDVRDGQRFVHVDHTRVHFRELTAPEITRYVDREQPLDCAGSFKAEGLGISLFAAIDSHDPSALIGLPLIALARMLRECGMALP